MPDTHPWPEADTVFEHKDQPFHGGGDTDGAKLPPVADSDLGERDRYEDNQGRVGRRQDGLV